jgi:hypothetical protein
MIGWILAGLSSAAQGVVFTVRNQITVIQTGLDSPS